MARLDEGVDCPDGPADSSAVERSERVFDTGLADDLFVLAGDVVDRDVFAALEEDDAEAEDDSSAQATPGAAVIAPPIPSATANAPTRPMHLEYVAAGFNGRLDEFAGFMTHP